VKRQCDFCGVTYNAHRSTSRWCSPSCRTKNSRGGMPAARAPEPPPDPSQPGPVESSVRGNVGHLLNGHPMADALAEMSFALARTLDDGAGLASAAVNRELCVNLLELARLAVADDDDLEARLSDPDYG